MATLQKTLPLILAGLLLGGCATTGTEQEPLKVPSGALDYKPAPPRPAELDVQSRMTQFTTPDPVVDIKLYSFRSTGQPVNLALSQLATAYGLNVVVDQDVEGQVTVDLKQLPLEKVLEAILEPLGLAWTWEKATVAQRSPRSWLWRRWATASTPNER